MVTFDMDLYKRALKLEYINKQFGEKWWLLPGPFHTSLCGIRCLGKTLEHSGIDEAWIQAGLYGSVVVNQIINGSHYDRAVEAHEITLQALADLWLGEFFAEKPLVLEALTESVKRLGNAFKITDKEDRDVKVKEADREFMILLEHMNLEQQLNEFDKNHEQFPMYTWTRIYMRQVLTLLAFHRSVKHPDLQLYLSSLERLCTYFFAYNRLDYAQNIVEFTARTYHSKETDPNLWQRLADGEFAVTKSNIPFTSIGVDQAQEHDNKNLKGEGGLQGITTKPRTLLKYCLAAPELARLSKETEDMFGVSHSRRDHHHKMSPAVTSRQEKAIQSLKLVLEQHNPFRDKGDKLYNIMNKKILSDKAQSSILSLETRGEEAKLSFVEQRICGEVNLWDRMTKVKFLNWDDLCKTVKLKCNTKEFQLQSSTSLMSRLLVIAKSQRSIDLQEAISTYEFNGVNHILMKPDGSLNSCKNKSDLVHALEQLTDTQDDEIALTTERKRYLVIDGMAVVQALMHAANFRTCKELGQSFAQRIDVLLGNYDGGRIIFDNYDKKLSIKDQIRYGSSSGAGEDLHITDLTPIKDKKQFLTSKTNKDSLTFFLADKAIDLCKKDVVTATRKNVLTNMTGYTPITGISSQEEADTLMIPHALELSATGAEVDFFTQDTDWWVLILRRLDGLGQNTGIVTGTGDNRRRVALQPVYDKLGKEKAIALPGFHAITGSDTTGQIGGIGKKTCLKVFMKAEPHVIDALSQLGQDDTPSREVIAGCQEFLCMALSTKQVNARDPATLRWKKFRRLSPSQGVDTLPPTEGTWLQHILRAHLQANIWAQDTVLNPKIPEPTELGWIREDDKLVPKLTEVPLAPEAVTELLLCKCVASKCSSGRCSCKLHNLPCTELCTCEANEDCCNTQAHISVDDLVDE